MPVERLRIGRFHVNCLVPRDHPAPEQIRRRMAEVVESVVPGAIASVIERAFAHYDDGLWFIRRLEFDCDINAAIDPVEVARLIALYATRVVADEMSAVGGDNVIHFDSPPQFLAAFLVDLAEGTAWRHWYYRAFEGLELLPASAAIRTAICEDVEAGLSALRCVGVYGLRRVLGRLSDADARRILEAVADAMPAADGLDEEFVARALEVLKQPSVMGLGREQLALVLVVERVAERLGVALCEALASVVLEEVAGREAEMLPEVVRARIAQALRPTPEEKERSVRTTAFGGAFFLLPLLDGMETGPSDGDRAAEGLTRWSILLQCFPPSAAHDPLLREVTGAPPDLPPFDNPTIELLSHSLLADFANRLPGFAASSRQYLHDNFLACAATIEREEHRSIVTIGRAPLSLILIVAGINRQHYELSWFGGHRYELYPANS